MTTSNSNRKRPAPSSYRDAVLGDTTPAAHLDLDHIDNATMKLGENGCPEYTNRGVGSDILAMSQMVRGSNPTSLCDELLANDSASVQDVTDLMVLLFVTRNTRGGKGEKDLSYEIFLRVWAHYPHTAKKLLRLFPHYGYWKDLLLLSEKAKKCDNDDGSQQQKALQEALLLESIDIMCHQLAKDVEAMDKYNRELVASTSQNGQNEIQGQPKNGPEISLLAKWLPREGSRFDKKLDFVARFTQAASTPSVPAVTPNGDSKPWKSKSKADYRKTIAKLTAFLDLPEVLLSAQRADEIKFHKLASKATFRLSKALLNETVDGANKRSEDPKRIRLAELFLEHLTKKGLKGGQLMPHEIVEEILKKKVSPIREKVLDAQWKSLWKSVVDQVQAKAKEEGLDFNPTRVVPLSDVSGSMSGTPMLVSIALGIGISEITHPAFRDMVLTFESRPKWHLLNSEDGIVQKVRSLARAPWGGSTNFEKAYDQILEVCHRYKLSREDVPSLIVFSDMQFNEAAGLRYGNARPERIATMHQVIRSKFEAAAKALGWEDSDPTPIVYWNLRDTGGHPVEKDTQGAVLLSGFSPSLLKLVMNGEALQEEEVEIVEMDGTVRKEKVRVTPDEVLRKMLNDSLYDPVRIVLAESNEGVLGDYELLEMEADPKAPVVDGFELV